MPGIINRDQERIKNLLELSLGIMQSQNVQDLLKKHKKSRDELIPVDIIAIVDKLVRMEFTTREIKKGVNKILNVFYQPLKNLHWDKPEPDTFLHTLMEENRMVEHILNKVKTLNKLINHPSVKSISNNDQTELQSLITRLQEFNLHYIKKENILFPYLEKYWEDFRCLHIMWSFHDDIRQSIAKLRYILQATSPQLDEYNREIGNLFFLIHNIIFREEFIVFPVASKTINPTDWEDMHFQSFEIGFAYIKKPSLKIEATDELVLSPDNSDLNQPDLLELQTGSLSTAQVNAILNSLPVDLTFVNEQNKVQFFSNPKQRIFPRSRAILGREVKNCHPPESVKTVEEILNSFKSGLKNHAQFWIKQNEKMILIEYYAIRDKYGKYQGCLEVSQDITKHREFEGEKRLLDWINQ